MMCIWVKYCPSSSKKWLSRTLAFDLNLSQVAINLGWIWWKHLFWQLLPNFCHPAHPASGSTPNPDRAQFYSWNVSELSQKGAAVEIVLQLLEFWLETCQNRETLLWKVWKCGHWPSLRNWYQMEIKEFSRWKFSFCSSSPNNNVWCPQVSFPRVCPPIQHRDPISQQMSWCRPISF